MAKDALRLIFAGLGVLIILITLFSPGNYRGLDSPIWGLLLGAGLIFLPFTAAAMFLAYALMVVIPFGSALLLAYVAVQIFGKDSIPAFIGFFAGGYFGFKFVVSDAFDKLLGPLRKVSDKDNS